MRRVLVAVALVLGALSVAACEPVTPPEPTVGMTAKSDPAKPRCGSPAYLAGSIGETATSKVVLQRTSGGKWVDWKWYETGDSDEEPHVLSDVPRYGEFMIGYRVPSSKTTIHLRARSAGGSVVSNGVYVTPVC